VERSGTSSTQQMISGRLRARWRATRCSISLHAQITSTILVLVVPLPMHAASHNGAAYLHYVCTMVPSCMQGIVVTGSASDSFSDEPWIARLRGEMAAAAARGQRILGVCFGCQIMALALGGKAGAGLARTWFTHAGCPG
jgi:hypothetical protein